MSKGPHAVPSLGITFVSLEALLVTFASPIPKVPCISGFPLPKLIHQNLWAKCIPPKGTSSLLGETGANVINSAQSAAVSVQRFPFLVKYACFHQVLTQITK